jgi:hypothetical protein
MVKVLRATVKSAVWFWLRLLKVALAGVKTTPACEGVTV